jgi:hypothetical protein
MPLRKNQEEYIIEGDVDSNLHTKHIFVVRSMVKPILRGSKYYVPVNISNLGQESVTLRKGQRIALMHVLQSDDLDDVILQRSDRTAEMAKNVNSIEATMVNAEKRLDKEMTHDIQQNRDEDETIEFIDEIEERCLDEKEVKKLLEDKIQHVDEIDGKRDRLRALLHEYIDLFNPPKFCFPRTSKVEHRIVTTTEEPIYERPSRIPHHLQPIVEEMIDDQRQKQIIREVVSPWNARLVMVRKKTLDGSTSYRSTIDLRSLNKITIPFQYEIPHISQSLDALRTGTLFSTLDVTSSFYLIPLSEDSQPKTAFTFRGKQYCYNRLVMGARSSTSVFQAFIDSVIGDISPDAALCYIDDTVVHGRDFETKLRNLRLVFERFRDANVTLNVKKCEFCKTEVDFCGYNVSNRGLKATERLTEKIRNAVVPVTKTHVRAFLSLTSFYRRFVKNYAHIAAPLNDLVKKGASENVVWTETCERAFQLLKNKLITAPVLKFPDFRKMFILDCDASLYAAGVVLVQEENGVEHPIGYASKKFSPAETRYSATERELAAIIFGVRHFKHYLLGAPKFIIRSDHKSLEWLRTLTTDNIRLTRWSLELESYNYEIQYRAGKKSGNCDGMSRLICAVDIITETDMKSAQLDDAAVSDYKKDNENFVIRDGLLYKKCVRGERLVIPRKIVSTLLSQYHDPKFAAHRGIRPMQKAISELYWWAARKKDVRTFVRTCEGCQKRSKLGAIKVPLRQHKECFRPFQQISIDVTMLPTSEDGYCCILTVVDFFSRYLIMVPMRDQKSATVAVALVKEVFLKMGVAEVMIMDNGRNFTGKLIEELCKLLDVKRQFCSIYSPFVNGRVERTHLTIKKKLSFYVSSNQGAWPQVLPYVVAAYNNTIHSSTGKTPHEVIFATKIVSPFEAAWRATRSKDDQVEDLRDKLKEIWQDVRVENQNAFKAYARQHNKKAKEHKFQVGDKVLVRDVVLKTGETKKLASLYKGPYIVLEVLSGTNIRIQGDKKKQILHVRNVKPYCERVLQNNGGMFQPEQEPGGSETAEEEGDIFIPRAKKGVAESSRKRQVQSGQKSIVEESPGDIKHGYNLRSRQKVK